MFVAIAVAVSVLCAVAYGAAMRMQWPTCSDVIRHARPETLRYLAGRTVVITGGNSGIGLHLAKAFSRIGARVVIGCRDLESARAVPARVIPLDLASPSSVEEFAAAARADEPKLVVFNAGMFPADQMQLIEPAGIERCFATNHVGALPARERHEALAGSGRPVRVRLERLAERAGIPERRRVHRAVAQCVQTQRTSVLRVARVWIQQARQLAVRPLLPHARHRQPCGLAGYVDHDGHLSAPMRPRAARLPPLDRPIYHVSGPGRCRRVVGVPRARPQRQVHQPLPASPRAADQRERYGR